MREILFKAKRSDTGEWIEGYYCKWKQMRRPVCILEEKVVDCIITWMSDGGMSRYEIDSETLCQYTGLKDKNDKQIWENDIVSCEHKKFQDGDSVEQYLFSDIMKYKRNYAVEFINTGSSYGYRLRNKSIHFMLTGNVIYNHNIEVIGNVFDNPELLKQDGDTNA